MNLRSRAKRPTLLFCRIEQFDFKQSHRYRGIGESDKFNKLTKSTQVDLQTENIKADYMQNLLYAKVISEQSTTNICNRSLQKYRTQINWRVKGE